MYMERDSERLKRFLICGVIFVIIAAMVYSNSVVFQLFDSMLQASLPAQQRTFGQC